MPSCISGCRSPSAGKYRRYVLLVTRLSDYAPQDSRDQRYDHGGKVSHWSKRYSVLSEKEKTCLAVTIVSRGFGLGILQVMDGQKC